MGFFDMLSRFGGSQIGRSVMGWFGQNVGTLLRKGASAVGGLLMKSPVGGAVRTLGPQVAEWVGEQTFDKAMRKFGDKIDDRVKRSRLAPVLDGMNLGDAYYSGMKNVYNFLRSGGEGYGDQSVNNQGQALIEKQQQQ